MIDDREPEDLFYYANFWNNDPQFCHFIIKKKRLEICDLLCKTKTLNGRVGIEIKRNDTGDFPSSIMDGRFPNQIIKAKKSKLIDNLIFIFVGNVENAFKNTKFRPESYYGALGSLQTKYSVNVNIVPNDSHAILLAFSLFKHSNLYPKEFPVYRVKIDKQRRQIAMLTCIEKVGEKSAEKVLIEYTIPELVLIKDPFIIKRKAGIRISTAKAIVDFFHERK